MRAVKGKKLITEKQLCYQHSPKLVKDIEQKTNKNATDGIYFFFSNIHKITKKYTNTKLFTWKKIIQYQSYQYTTKNYFTLNLTHTKDKSNKTRDATIT